MVDEQTVSSVELAHDDTLSFQNAEFEISIREEHASDQDVIKCAFAFGWVSLCALFEVCRCCVNTLVGEMRPNVLL